MRNTLAGILLTGFGSAAASAAVIGYTETFNSGQTSWDGGSSLTTFDSGGVGGASDGWLRVRESPLAGRLGVYSQGPEFTGDLVADGVTGFSFYLSNIDDSEPMEIHVGIGSAFVNVWLCIDGYTLPSSGWQQFEVDITDESRWVQIIGSGTFQEALASSNRLLFRHDLAPFIQAPNEIAGDFGLDEVTVLGTAPCTGDADEDGDIDLDDLLLVLGGFGTAGPSGDLDGDGDVDLDDLLLVLGQFGIIC